MVHPQVLGAKAWRPWKEVCFCYGGLGAPGLMFFYYDWKRELECPVSSPQGVIAKRILPFELQREGRCRQRSGAVTWTLGQREEVDVHSFCDRLEWLRVGARRMGQRTVCRTWVKVSWWRRVRVARRMRGMTREFLLGVTHQKEWRVTKWRNSRLQLSPWFLQAKVLRATCREVEKR